jgi:RNA polymerase sigma factor (sigma-70 family)
VSDSKSAKYRRELNALAENIPFKVIDLPALDGGPYPEPESVRQERTYVRMESGMQAIGRFLAERGTVEILSAEQTRTLFAEIHWCADRIRKSAARAHRGEGGWHRAVVEARGLISRMEAAEEELFIANRRLVVRCVKPFFWIGQVWLSDFLQEGSKALSNAIRKFDFTRGTPFYAYAQKAIQNRLRNYFRDHVRSGSIGMQPSRDMMRVLNAVESWVRIHGEEPGPEALSQVTGMPRSRVNQLLGFIQQWKNVPSPPVSLDALLGDSSANLHDLIEDEDAPDIPEAAQVAEIWTAIDQLPERSRRIMRLRFIEGRTLEETGRMLNLTRARIKQIQDDSIRKLRSILKEGIHREP